MVKLLVGQRLERRQEKAQIVEAGERNLKVSYGSWRAMKGRRKVILAKRQGGGGQRNCKVTGKTKRKGMRSYRM